MKQNKTQKPIHPVSLKILNDLYQSTYSIQTPDSKEENFEAQHSLSLLCAGYKGIVALRKMREQSAYINMNEYIFEHREKKSNEKK